ncbi:DUF5658 family protein [Bacillus sp. FJAT-27245]|uniref:DUF5658 family protein n=1 Tax=Bacillus sp. FJAT-27245 TaxID=1684144 RepID=UPI0006A7CA3A|nr:DUF5658 family protein [Bacillus sp. FJAT-27245]
MIKWIYLLAALNFLDGIATYAGMKALLFNEANPLLAGMPPGAILFLKLALSLAILLLVRKANVTKPIFKIFVAVGNGVYLLIAAMHLYWLSILIV